MTRRAIRLLLVATLLVAAVVVTHPERAAQRPTKDLGAGARERRAVYRLDSAPAPARRSYMSMDMAVLLEEQGRERLITGRELIAPAMNADGEEIAVPIAK